MNEEERIHWKGVVRTNLIENIKVVIDGLSNPEFNKKKSGFAPDNKVNCFSVDSDGFKENSSGICSHDSEIE